MPITVLVVGNDIHVHKLIVDILEITLKEVVIDRTTSVDGLLKKIRGQVQPYDLIILDCRNEKTANEGLIKIVTTNFPDMTDRLIVLIDSLDEKPSDAVIQDIPCVLKPFSLDVFGDLIKNKVTNKS